MCVRYCLQSKRSSFPAAAIVQIHCASEMLVRSASVAGPDCSRTESSDPPVDTIPFMARLRAVVAGAVRFGQFHNSYSSFTKLLWYGVVLVLIFSFLAKKSGKILNIASYHKNHLLSINVA